MKCLLALALSFGCVASAQAIPPFRKAFTDLYAKPGTPLEAKVKEAKCNVCHIGMAAKVRNDFGKAVGLHLKKTDRIPKAIADGLAKALEERSPSGKTFKEIMEGGSLPGE